MVEVKCRLPRCGLEDKVRVRKGPWVAQGHACCCCGRVHGQGDGREATEGVCVHGMHMRSCMAFRNLAMLLNCQQ